MVKGGGNELNRGPAPDINFGPGPILPDVNFGPGPILPDIQNFGPGPILPDVNFRGGGNELPA
jgi:hypothetical protein